MENKKSTECNIILGNISTDCKSFATYDAVLAALSYLSEKGGGSLTTIRRLLFSSDLAPVQKDLDILEENGLVGKCKNGYTLTDISSLEEYMTEMFMGKDNYICSKCHTNIMSHEHYKLCDKCDNSYCEVCKDDCITHYTSIGKLCPSCDDYGKAPEPYIYDICDYMYETYNTNYEEMKEGWKKKQKVRNLPCFRCEKDTCLDSYCTRVKFTEKELATVENVFEEQYGCCCDCSKKLKSKWCTDCKSHKKIKK